MILGKGAPGISVNQAYGDGGYIRANFGVGCGAGNAGSSVGQGCGKGTGYVNGDGHSYVVLGILNGDWVGGEGCVVRGGL